MKQTLFGIWIILLLICVSYTMPLYSQVTIGSNEKAMDFETLRIDGDKKGLRLSRLTQSQRDALELTLRTDNSDISNGLTIYNTDSGRIEFWDNANLTWRTLSVGDNTFDNGVSFNSITKKGELGGVLNENTEIDQNGNPLNFVTSGAGSFTINDTDLIVNNTSVVGTGLTNMTISPPASSVNFAVTGQTNVSADVGSKLFNVNNGALRITEDSVAATGSFHYIDGNQSTGGVNATRVLTSDANGLASWTQLTAVIVSKNLGVKWPGTNSNGDFSTSAWTDVCNEFTLEKGKWLVMGRLGTYTYGTITTTANYLNLIRLQQTSPSASTKYVFGALPERKSTSDNGDSESSSGGGAYCTPMMMAYVEVAATEEKFKIQFKTAKTNTRRARASWMGTSYFRAIKIGD